MKAPLSFLILCWISMVPPSESAEWPAIVISSIPVIRPDLGSIGGEPVHVGILPGLPVEPSICGLGHGQPRFFQLIASDGGTLILDTIGSQFDTVLGVFSMTNLLQIVPLACDNDSAPDGLRSIIRLNVETGVSYLVALAGVNDAKGLVQLNWTLGSAPAIEQTSTVAVVRAGRDFTLSIASTNWIPSPSLQWHFNGTSIPGATERILQLTNLQPDQAGSYSVVVSSKFGRSTVTVAELQVLPAVQLRMGTVTSPEGPRPRLTTDKSGKLVLSATGDFIQWLPLFTNQFLNMNLDFIDGPLAEHARRFCRAEPWP